MQTTDRMLGDHDRTPDEPARVHGAQDPMPSHGSDLADVGDDRVTGEFVRGVDPSASRPVASAISHGPRRHRRTRPRGMTIAMKRVSLADLQLGAAMYPPVELDRPRTRADCSAEARPCPWVACKHHLYLDINPTTGSIKINFPDREPWELEHTCALDIAEAGGKTLDEIGEITNLTRERIRQVEVRGLLKLRTRRELR